jgi:hypothetical protein
MLRGNSKLLLVARFFVAAVIAPAVIVLRDRNMRRQFFIIILVACCCNAGVITQQKGFKTRIGLRVQIRKQRLNVFTRTTFSMTLLWWLALGDGPLHCTRIKSLS